MIINGLRATEGIIRNSNSDGLHRVVSDTGGPIEFVEEKDPAAIYQQMLQRIAALEATIAKVPTPAPGIGHNHPPEPIDAPLTNDQIGEVRRYLAAIKAQPPVPPTPPEEASRAATRLRAFGRKVLAYIDVFLTEGAKTAGKQFQFGPCLAIS